MIRPVALILFPLCTHTSNSYLDSEQVSKQQNLMLRLEYIVLG